MSRIVAVRKNGDGTISSYKLDDGTVLNHTEAINAVNNGEVDGVATFETRDGGMAIRSNRGQYGYSLSELPEF